MAAPEGNRADLGFGEELDSFDPADWAPKPKPRPKPAPETQAASRQLAEATGFRSREPAPAEATDGQGGATRKPAPKPAVQKALARPPRRRRTGRNAQFNIKARPETIDAFCAVADAHGWGLGETLEHAVALLEQHHGKGKG